MRTGPVLIVTAIQPQPPIGCKGGTWMGCVVTAAAATTVAKAPLPSGAASSSAERLSVNHAVGVGRVLHASISVQRGGAAGVDELEERSSSSAERRSTTLWMEYERFMLCKMAAASCSSASTSQPSLPSCSTVFPRHPLAVFILASRLGSALAGAVFPSSPRRAVNAGRWVPSACLELFQPSLVRMDRTNVPCLRNLE